MATRPTKSSTMPNQPPAFPTTQPTPTQPTPAQPEQPKASGQYTGRVELDDKLFLWKYQSQYNDPDVWRRVLGYNDQQVRAVIADIGNNHQAHASHYVLATYHGPLRAYVTL